MNFEYEIVNNNTAIIRAIISSGCHPVLHGKYKRLDGEIIDLRKEFIVKYFKLHQRTFKNIILSKNGIEYDDKISIDVPTNDTELLYIHEYTITKENQEDLFSGDFDDYIIDITNEFISITDIVTTEIHNASCIVNDGKDVSFTSVSGEASENCFFIDNDHALSIISGLSTFKKFRNIDFEDTTNTGQRMKLNVGISSNFNTPQTNYTNNNYQDEKIQVNYVDKSKCIVSYFTTRNNKIIKHSERYNPKLYSFLLIMGQVEQHDIRLFRQYEDNSDKYYVQDGYIHGSNKSHLGNEVSSNIEIDFDN